MEDDKLIINEAAFFDKAASIYLLTRLNRNFKKWPAYKLGLIDDKGNVLRPTVTNEEKKALGAFDKLIIRIKRAMGPKALKILSAISIYKILTEDEKLPENIKFKNDTMVYLFEKMIHLFLEGGKFLYAPPLNLDSFWKPP